MHQYAGDAVANHAAPSFVSSLVQRLFAAAFAHRFSCAGVMLATRARPPSLPLSSHVIVCFFLGFPITQMVSEGLCNVNTVPD